MIARVVIAGALALVGLARADILVEGHVASDTNAPVANAAVTLTSVRGDHYRAFTDATGEFHIYVPEPGPYLAGVERTGFFSLKDRPVSIVPSGSELRLTLNPQRELSESVDVRSATTDVALDGTSSPAKLSGANLLDVPYPVTHNLTNAMRILPGVVQDSAGGIHVNGGGEDQVQYLLDGFDIADPLTHRLEARVSVEAVQSMEVIGGRFAAEYGKGSSGVVTVNTKNGDDRIRYSATNFVPGVESSKGLRVGSWNPRVNLSGPLYRGRAWFSDSLTAQYDQTVIHELPSGQDASTSWRYGNMLRGQINLTPSNILYTSFLANQWKAARTGLSALDPWETTVDRRSRQWFGTIKDQIYLPHGMLVEFGYGSNRTFTRQIPQGHDFYRLTPTGRSGNFFVNGLIDASRDQWLANVFLPSFRWLGSHQMKAGIDADRVAFNQDFARTGFESYSSNALVRRVVYSGNGKVGESNVESTAYLQDSWRARPNVLIEFGLRGDWDRILKNWNVSPRAGVAWSPFGLENTKISGGYALTYDATNLRLFTRPSDQVAITTIYPPYGVPDLPVASVYMIPGGRFASPRFSNWSAALDQRLFSNLYLKTQAMRRRGERGLTYSQLPLANPSFYALGNRRSDAYDSVELTMRQNLRKQYEWLVSYTRSRAASNAVIDLSSDQPAIVGSNVGRMPWDAPNRFLSWGYLPTFWDNWAIAYLSEYRTGFPFSVQNEAAQIVGPVNSRRFPGFFELNLHVERRFRFHGQLWSGRVGYNNITNHRNPNVVNNDLDSPQFLTFAGGQHRALVFRLRWLGKL